MATSAPQAVDIYDPTPSASSSSYEPGFVSEPQPQDDPDNSPDCTTATATETNTHSTLPLRRLMSHNQPGLKEAATLFSGGQSTRLTRSSVRRGENVLD